MKRGGFTLAEMIVVLAVVASVMALALPAIIAPLGKAELRQSALQFRAELGEARTRAIESGVAQEFRYERGGRRYIVSPRGGLNESGNPLTPAAAADARGPFDASAETLAGELPDGILFTTPAFGAGTGSTSLGENGESPQPVDAPVPTTGLTDVTPGGEPAADASGGAWSPPIAFYPNGRSDNARIWLRGSKDLTVEVTLRGLTGSATVGELVRPQPEEAGP